LLRQLFALVHGIAPLTFLSSLYDDDWFREVEAEIRNADLENGFRSDSVPIFMLLRGQGEFLRELERRVACIAAVLPGGAPKLKSKLDEIRSSRSSAQQFDFLFELSLLGLIAGRGHLADISVQVGTDEKHGNVDGVLRLDARDVLVEAAHVRQKVLPDGRGVWSINTEALKKQIHHKLKKKIASDKQLAHTGDRPAILAIALSRLGAGQPEAKWALDEAFAKLEFTSLTAVIVSDTWKLISWTLHVNPNSRCPLTEHEVSALVKCLGGVRTETAADVGRAVRMLDPVVRSGGRRVRRQQDALRQRTRPTGSR
jgi:hypothetical protein